MTFVDTNIIVDILQDDPVWREWSVSMLDREAVDGELIIDSVVIAELSRGFESLAALRDVLDRLHLRSFPLEDEAAFLAGQRCASFRQRRSPGEARRVLPDFFIGAHAVTLGEPLLTRDPDLYRRFFPELPLITPEGNDG